MKTVRSRVLSLLTSILVFQALALFSPPISMAETRLFEASDPVEAAAQGDGETQAQADPDFSDSLTEGIGFEITC